MTRKDLQRTITLLHRVVGNIEGRNNCDIRELGSVMDCNIAIQHDVLIEIGRLEKIVEEESYDAND